tara:strand:+ start:858 stop:1358 length:501 start_codon:yes stop_codon:yes gene_type:complete
MLKLELTSTVDDNLISTFFNNNKDGISKILRFDSPIESEAVDANDTEEQLKRIKWHFSDAALPQEPYKIIDTTTNNVVGYLSLALGNIKIHTGLNLSSKTWEEIAPAIHEIMVENNLSKWQIWAQYEESNKSLVESCYNRTDLFSLDKVVEIDAHAADCLLILNRV